MKNFLIFVMLFNINHHDKKSSLSNLKYTSQAVATLPMGNVEQPSACAGFFIMEKFDLFNQPPVENVEIWKDVLEYEGFYQVSTLGNVRSLDKTVPCALRHQTDRFIKGQALNIRQMWQGYSTICLYKNGKGRHFRLHRIVAKLFIPNPENKPDVNHKNGIKTDNRVDNLEWCTKSENMIHAVQTGLQDTIGENNHNTKMTEKQVIAMRIDYANGLTFSQIVAKYNTPYYATNNMLLNKSWKYLLTKK